MMDDKTIHFLIRLKASARFFKAAQFPKIILTDDLLQKTKLLKEGTEKGQRVIFHCGSGGGKTAFHTWLTK